MTWYPYLKFERFRPSVVKIDNHCALNVYPKNVLSEELHVIGEKSTAFCYQSQESLAYVRSLQGKVFCLGPILGSTVRANVDSLISIKECTAPATTVWSRISSHVALEKCHHANISCGSDSSIDGSADSWTIQTVEGDAKVNFQKREDKST